jgi:hypothetical protein
MKEYGQNMVVDVTTIDVIYDGSEKIDDVIYGWPLCSPDFSTGKIPVLFSVGL